MFQMEACKISDVHIDQLFDDANHNLKYLGLINLGITLEGKPKKKHSITNMLNCKKSKIETLSLNCNKIGVKGALVLA